MVTSFTLLDKVDNSVLVNIDPIKSFSFLKHLALLIINWIPFTGREQKTSERFSPVRRGSEGSAGGSRTLSPSTPQQECQRLQRGLQNRNSPPRSIPGR